MPRLRVGCIHPRAEIGTGVQLARRGEAPVVPSRGAGRPLRPVASGRRAPGYCAQRCHGQDDCRLGLDRCTGPCPCCRPTYGHGRFAWR